jgi:hypothetical protein
MYLEDVNCTDEMDMSKVVKMKFLPPNPLKGE